MSTFRVVFTPSGQRGEVAAGTSVLAAARQLGVDLDSVCGGRGICGRCQIEPSTGDFAKFDIRADHAALTPANEAEARYSRLRGLGDGRRLGCQALLCTDAVIDVPATSQVHRQIVRKAAEAHDIAVDPVVRLCCVRVREPDMDDPTSDFSRLQLALSETFGLSPLKAALPVLAGLQKALRAGAWQVTVAVRKDEEIVALWPGLVDRCFGMAVDLGSTTIAAHLCDLARGDVVASAGQMNPQIRFGEDLMSRVSYAMMNPGGAEAMTAAVRVAINDLAGALAAEAGIARDAIVEMTMVGNPVMHHLFLGLDPVELGGAPFALTVDGGMDTPAATLGLSLAPGAMVYTLPCIAGHVGADMAGVVLAERPDLAEDLTLLVDIGTNAELVLGDRNRLTACSSPTGPAFEGAQIACGQRAAAGAIERFRLNPDTLEPRFRVIGCALWSDEPGFAEATASTGVTGICGSGVIEIIGELVLAGLIRADGVIDPAGAARTPRISATGRTFAYEIIGGDTPIRLYQTDVRAIQLAKAALHAGAALLQKRFEGREIAHIRLAGAFGSHIDVTYALILGLLPDCDLERVSSAGNAAGTGARIALLNRASRGMVERIARDIEKIETAVEPEFQTCFVGAMAFPHASDPYVRLARSVKLPERTLAEGQGEGRRRGRRTLA